MGLMTIARSARGDAFKRHYMTRWNAPRPPAQVRARWRTRRRHPGRRRRCPRLSIPSITMVLLLPRAARRGHWCPWDLTHSRHPEACRLPRPASGCHALGRPCRRTRTHQASGVPCLCGM